MSNRLGTYKGRVFDALRAFRPIVDAVCALHTEKVVHDIKPDNIFVALDGHLVLGDCGLAFGRGPGQVDANMGERGHPRFSPPWSYGRRRRVRQHSTFSLAQVHRNGVRSPEIPPLVLRQTRDDARCSRMNLLSSLSTKSLRSALWNRKTRRDCMMQVSFSEKSTLQLRRCRMAASCLDGSAGCGVGFAASGRTRSRELPNRGKSGQGTRETTTYVATADTSSHSSGRRASHRLRGLRATSTLVSCRHQWDREHAVRLAEAGIDGSAGRPGISRPRHCERGAFPVVSAA